MRNEWGTTGKVCSHWPQWLCWTPQEYIQNQCKDVIILDVTSGNANLATHTLRIKRWVIHRLIAWNLKNGTFWARSNDIVPQQPISVEFLPMSMTSQCHECCQHLMNGHWIRHGGQNNCYCVWIPQSSYSITLYTTGLSNEHRSHYVKFSNISGTSTTDTVQLWWLNRLWLMIENDLLPPDLLPNANCGWYRALRHNIIDSEWFY